MKISCRAFISSLVIFCSIFLVQCSKETTTAPDNLDGLPNATQTGANTFATELTGAGIYDDTTIFISYIPFVADNDLNDPLYSNSGNGAWLSNDTLTISGAPQVGSYFQGIRLTIIGNLQQGSIYKIDSVNTIATTSTDSTCNGITFLSYYTSISDSGTVQLTKFDTVNKIVSGVFTCNFTFPQCDSIIYATLGRFDYKYH